MDNTSEQRAAAQRGVILPEVCTVQDLAFHFDRPHSSILRLLRCGVIPARKLGGRWYTTRLDVLGVLEPNNAPLPPWPPRRPDDERPLDPPSSPPEPPQPFDFSDRGVWQ